MQIQISWLLQKPNDLGLHCLQRQGISGFSRTRVKRAGEGEGRDYITSGEATRKTVKVMYPVFFLFFFFWGGGGGGLQKKKKKKKKDEDIKNLSKHFKYFFLFFPENRF